MGEPCPSLGIFMVSGIAFSDEENFSSPVLSAIAKALLGGNPALKLSKRLNYQSVLSADYSCLETRNIA